MKTNLFVHAIELSSVFVCNLCYRFIVHISHWQKKNYILFISLSFSFELLHSQNGIELFLKIK